MKATIFATVAGFAVQQAAAHATFQDLWINGVDQMRSCARLPLSNSPVQDVTSNDLACNAGTSPVATKCAVKGGDTVTVEMHQQPGDRSCANEAIGGAHYGPVSVYLAKVTDATTAVGSSAGWFKIFEDSWGKDPTGSTGSDDYWGTKDLNTCCGKLNVPIPTSLAAGDYLLRAEALALHAAGSTGGAQFYMTCFQLSISSSGTTTPATVSLPGAYSASDPGILINIYQAMTSYTPPGPAVIAGGDTRVAGSPCLGCESTCAPGAAPTAQPTTSAAAPPKTTLTTAPIQTTSVAKPPTTTTSAAPVSGGGVAKYGQCGGTGWTGGTVCVAGSTCTVVNAYYSQCM